MLISFTPSLRDSKLAFPVFIVLGSVTSFAWAWLVREISDNSKIFVWSMAWDISMLFVFYLIPMMFFDLRFPLSAKIGFALVLLGSLLIKFS